MSFSLRTLSRVLALERQQGHADRAVIGGLEAFVARWEAEFGAEAPPSVRVAVAGLHGYAELPVGTREKRVGAVLAAADWAPGLVEADGRDATPQASAAPPRPLRASPGGAGTAELDRPVVHMRGIGRRSAENLSRLGIQTVRDLLFHVPSRHRDYSRVEPIGKLRMGESATVVGAVWDVRSRPLPGNRHLLTVILNDTTASVGCTFFNQAYLEREFRPGRRVVVSGTVEVWAGRKVFRSPECEPLDHDLVHTGRLVPVYPTTGSIGQRWLRRQIKAAVDQYADRVPDPLPDRIREQHRLLPSASALRELHFPADWAALAEARRRMAFDALFVLHVRGRIRRRKWQARRSPTFEAGRPMMEAFVASLPFVLTGDQRRSIDEIAADLAAPVPMLRLLQGDVGSGKTAVAAAAASMAVGAGYQVAIMAPTEILAEQHLSSLGRLLAPVGFRAWSDANGGDQGSGRTASIGRLVGSMRRSDKEAVVEAARSGTVDILVGTHALIQTDVAFDRLGLAVVDEQHRFGVLQRSELALKGAGPGSAGAGAGSTGAPHLLVMTATPIPRTLAQVLNADLDQSVIAEVPPGRKPIVTRRLGSGERERAYQFIRHRVARGEQAYVVYALVEGSESVEARSAVEEFERLSREVFPDLRLGLVHGRLSPAEKDDAMRRFYGGETDVLVATSVVEVGVDVPNATVMLVDGADRFGLAQLHQFRGRVGRGVADSVCLLLADAPSEAAVERLEAMVGTADGLQLADLDLRMRGPGDYFGVQQSGLVDGFRFARLADSAVVEQARESATELLQRDPDLAAAELAPLRELLVAFGATSEGA